MPKDVPVSRGDETRNLLLETGLRLFAIHGFESVSTRQLTNESGCNIAAINYHFDGKEGLYRAVLEQLVIDTEVYFGPSMAKIQDSVRAASGDRQKLAQAITSLISNLFNIFLENEFMRWRMPLVMREYANPSENFEVLYKGRIEPLHKAITVIASMVLEKPADDPECAIRAHAILGQIVIFGIARVVLWKRLEWENYTPERVALIAKVATQSVLNSIGLDPVEPSSKGA
ncbi:MAG: CerR family C-terminal domain-containing protein [Rhodospirillaceae bacterium]|nr:CerR family C-terminal domain-containing protein [Rhodospirillaceae bacterium]MBT4589637.1 CerR family C-terminal domain-containing protein [Rhodospirillaceae bacterium]MBT5939476.1 CerR family C-terminal domain-containing protein [Rhodospirillaceae bacterium]MBT7269184.1 CerR family C-terminal domain-containing protein [Rhodospirillaceae bacterium]